MKKTITLIVSAFLLIVVGCVKVKTDEEIEVGKLRHKIFIECMELASKITRQSDDDVSDIIDECSNEAYYIANHMSK